MSQSFLTGPKAPPREALSEGHSFQQFGIPAGRADALLPEPAPEPEADPVPLPELPEAMPEVEEPVVVPDDDPLAWFLSRAMLLLTSQHWFEADVELDPVPVPCALARVARPKSAVPKAAARYNFFMDVSSFVHRPIAGAHQMRNFELRSSRYLPIIVYCLAPLHGPPCHYSSHSHPAGTASKK